MRGLVRSPVLLATLAWASLAPGPAHADDTTKARTALPPSRSTVDLSRGGDRAVRTPEDTLVDDLRAIWAGRPLRRGVTAIYVADAHTGEVLFAVHEDRALNPASNVKLVSTAAVLDILGPDWRYVTRLYGPAMTAEGVIDGDLYLLGDHDPTLGVDHLRAMAQSLRDQGVVRVTGDIVIGASETRDAVGHPGVRIEVRGGAEGEPPAIEVSPATDLVHLVNSARTTDKLRRPRISSSATTVTGADGVARYTITVGGHVRPGATRALHRNVPDGPRFTAHALRGALRDAGIEVTGGVRVQEFDAFVRAAADRGVLAIELARRESAPVRKLIARINKPSNNFLADRLVATAGAVRYGGEPTLAKGVRAMNEWLRDIGVDPGECVLDTGSGLSYASKLTARQIARVLMVGGGYLAPRRGAAMTASVLPVTEAVEVGSITYAGGGVDGSFLIGLDVDRRPALATTAEPIDPEPIWLASLAVAGVDGTLRGRYKTSAVHGKMIGKTGTLTSVIALSGFVRLDDDHEVVFAIVTNGHRHRQRNIVRFEHRKMTEVILRYLTARRDAGL